jgi:hypothetical protein
VTRPLPLTTPDTQWWWEGLNEKKLLIQRCEGCHRPRHPPVPSCPSCHSLEWSATPASGRGIVYSVTVLHHPPLPGFDYPLAVAVIELAEGTRIVSNVVGSDPDQVHIGQAVEVEFFDVEGGARLHRFRVVQP